MLLSADSDISDVVELLKKEYNRRADFSPLLWSKGMKLQLKEVYTKLRVVSRRKAGSSELLKRECNRRAHFSPLPWSKAKKLQRKKVHTKLGPVSEGEAESSEIDLDDIFGSSEEDNDPLVLIEGSPGIGKTTFCLKLAHDWANGAMPRNFASFKLVFLLKCRDMKGDITEDIVQAIFEQLLPEDLTDKTKEALVNFLEDK